MIEENKRTTFKGFCLFNDIEDYMLKTRNRAVVLANLAEDNSEQRRINGKGAALILGYFQMVPSDEREDVKTAFANAMVERGFRFSV